MFETTQRLQLGDMVHLVSLRNEFQGFKTGAFAVRGVWDAFSGQLGGRLAEAALEVEPAADCYILVHDTVASSISHLKRQRPKARVGSWHYGMWTLMYSGEGNIAAWRRRQPWPVQGLHSLFRFSSPLVLERLYRHLSQGDFLFSESRFIAEWLFCVYGIFSDAVLYLPPLDQDEIEAGSLCNETRGSYFLTTTGETAAAVIGEIAKFARVVTIGRGAIEGCENLGFVADQQQLMRLYANALATLCPLTTEPFGYVPVESMLCGTPVITYSYQGPGETVVDGQTGWTAATPAAFVDLARHVWLHRYSAAMRRQCQEYAMRRFSVAACTTAFLDALAKVLGAGAKRWSQSRRWLLMTSSTGVNRADHREVRSLDKLPQLLMGVSSSQISDNEIRTRPCPDCYLCGTQGEPLYQGLQDHFFSVPGEWNLKKCPNPECGLLWLDPMPIEEDIGKAYQTYYTHQEGSPNGEKGSLGKFLKLNLRRAYNILLRATPIYHERKQLSLMYLEKTPPGRLLEVGCGSGLRLAQMRALGWKVEGQEVDPKAAAQARSTLNLPVHLGALEDAEFAVDSFDAITMNHVIEHVYDPVALLAKCRRVLKPSGRLVATTPNAESYGHKHFESCWWGLDPPRHLHLFSESTLRTCAERAGFRTVETWTTSANAESIYLGSLHVQASQKHRMGLQHQFLGGLAQAAGFHLWEFFLVRWHPRLGEEAVLKVVK
ncbi:MAG: methyltransferase domain-containing protein [Deinococcus sp.]|nr:methyltransferase domain-containing protein [Deinococcus sp.]